MLTLLRILDAIKEASILPLRQPGRSSDHIRNIYRGWSGLERDFHYGGRHSVDQT
jgi:hypothetical protein